MVEKMRNKRMHAEHQKNYNMQNKRMRVCRSPLKLQNKRIRIYPLLAIRPQKSRGGNYTKHNRTNKIN